MVKDPAFQKNMDDYIKKVQIPNQHILLFTRRIKQQFL